MSTDEIDTYETADGLCFAKVHKLFNYVNEYNKNKKLIIFYRSYYYSV